MQPPNDKPVSPVRPLSTAARTLLVQCREIARTRLSRALSEAIVKVEEDLLKLADATRDVTERQVLLEAVSNVRHYRDVVATTFEKSFVDIFDKRMSGPATTDFNRTASLSLDDLSLVETNTLDEELAVTELARETKNLVDPQELLGIRARMSHLLGLELIDDKRNPLAPEGIYEALRLACAKIPGDFTTKRSLLTAFKPYVVRALGAVYADVNQSLISHQILPKIRHTVQRAADTGVSTSQAMHTAQLGVSQPLHAPHPGTTQPMGTIPHGVTVSQAMRAEGLVANANSNTTQQLAVNQLLSLGIPGAGGEVGTPGLSERTDLATALTNALDAPPEKRRLVARMLSDPVRYSFDAVISTPPSPTLVTSLTQLQSAPMYVGHGTDYLNAIEPGVRSQAHPLDMLTVEFVNIVFDHILNDRSIPEGVKSCIARLQIVAVKAAILDRTFFARRDHPMRRLLDRIAGAAVDPEIDTTDESAFVEGLRGIVGQVVNHFQDDLGVFAQAEAQIETLIGRLSLSQTTEFKSTAAALEQKERAEVAHTSALAEIKRRVNSSTPVFLREFLVHWWSKVLVESYMKELQGDDSWTRRLSIVDALVWSTGMLAKSEVNQLATMLPNLMRSILRAMASLDMPVESRRRFFDELMKAHTSGIEQAKNIIVKPQRSPAPPAPELEELPEVKEHVGDYFEHAVMALERGALVEFTDGDQVVRSKLSWISPQHTIYLFTATGSNARSFAPSALADSLREGKARILEASEAMMDRVVRSVVGEGEIPERLAA